jgi:hypothetical protein
MRTERSLAGMALRDAGSARMATGWQWRATHHISEDGGSGVDFLRLSLSTGDYGEFGSSQH